MRELGLAQDVKWAEFVMQGTDLSQRNRAGMRLSLQNFEQTVKKLHPLYRKGQELRKTCTYSNPPERNGYRDLNTTAQKNIK